MNKTRSLLMLLAVLFLVPICSVAQSRYRFEVYAAASFPQDKEFTLNPPQSTTPIPGSEQFLLGGRGGVRLGADGKGQWGQDFIYSYGTNATSLKLYSPGKSFAFTSRIHNFSYNTLWYPGGLHAKQKFFPYLTLGVGGTFATINQSASNAAALVGLGSLKGENNVAVNFGAGIRIRINSVYGISFAARDIMSQPFRYGLPSSSSDPAAAVLPVSGIFHQPEVSAAFVYYFK